MSYLQGEKHSVDHVVKRIEKFFTRFYPNALENMDDGLFEKYAHAHAHVML